MRLLKRAGLVYVGSRGSLAGNPSKELGWDALIELARTGYSGYLIELAGRIVDVGDTPEEVATFLQEAAQEMAVNLRAEGQELPLSAVIIRRLSVA